MKFRGLIAICGLAISLLHATARAENAAVLVTSIKSPIVALTPADIRKAYLGVSIAVNGEVILPLRNIADPALEEAFLQKVLFMSRSAYERLLLTKIMHGNRVTPIAYDSEVQLQNALFSNPVAISFMWESQAGKPGIKVIARLWPASN